MNNKQRSNDCGHTVVSETMIWGWVCRICKRILGHDFKKVKECTCSNHWTGVGAHGRYCEKCTGVKE